MAGLQGQVYGKGIANAKVIDGFEAFLRRCHVEGCAVMIISHKTEYGHYDPDRVNLRQAARDWMATRRLLDSEHGVSAASVFFESSRAESSRASANSPVHILSTISKRCRAIPASRRG